MAKGRIKNEEIWQQIREEIIHVLLHNSDITKNEEIVSYFHKYYSQYNVELEDIEHITRESGYINQLLKKNAGHKIEFEKRLRLIFNEIITSQVIEIESEKDPLHNEEDTTELDKEIVVGLHHLFKKVLDDNNIIESMMHVDIEYQDLLEEIGIK